MNISTKQKRIQRTDLWLSRERGMEVGSTGTFGLADTNYYTYMMGKQQGPTVYSTGNYIQYPVINYNGKVYQKNVYISVCECV